jgi:hypothetical protein
MRIELDVPLRGTRDYLQSGDIYRAFADHLRSQFPSENFTSLRFKFNHFARAGVDAVYWPIDASEPMPKDPNALLWFGFADGRRFQGYFEENGKPINRRIEGAEPEITATTSISGETATTPAHQSADLIEHVVFVTKKLHNTLMPPATGRWIVVEFNFTRFLEKRVTEPITIVLKHSYEQRLTESEIQIGSENVGTVRFLVWT